MIKEKVVAPVIYIAGLILIGITVSWWASLGVAMILLAHNLRSHD